MACRTQSRAEDAIKEIKGKVPNANIEFMQLNLASLKSVQSFAEAFKARGLPLHVLMNNAGMYFDMMRLSLSDIYYNDHQLPMYCSFPFFFSTVSRFNRYHGPHRLHPLRRRHRTPNCI
jgi:NAD(P)-dependent dehydrogenase (short-subunit alcohol dehydrogenase family)